MTELPNLTPQEVERLEKALAHLNVAYAAILDASRLMHETLVQDGLYHLLEDSDKAQQGMNYALAHTTWPRSQIARFLSKYRSERNGTDK